MPCKNNVTFCAGFVTINSFVFEGYDGGVFGASCRGDAAAEDGRGSGRAGGRGISVMNNPVTSRPFVDV